MAFLKIDNVAIRGLAACAPVTIEENADLPVFEEGEAERVINQTGIVRKHVVPPGTTALDLCKAAMEKLLEDLKWEKDSIDVLIFVSTTFDHIIPPVFFKVCLNYLKKRFALIFVKVALVGRTV